MKPAIVYLAQNTTRDRLYGRDSRSMLEKSLELLYKHYNGQFRHDVLIFHEGDFSERDQAEVAQGRPEISFRKIQFDLPDFLPRSEVPEVWVNDDGSRYGMGHRNMIRFYAVLLFDILDALGYDWFFRLDDDSFIHSRIDYNLFEFMEKNGYEYGYRVDIRDPSGCARGFGEAVLAYLKAENIKPTSFLEHCPPARSMVHFKNGIKVLLMKLSPHRKYAMGPSGQYDLWGYYNNFFITKVSFWKRPDVQAFIRHFDRIGGWYKYRWNDLIFQSAAVQVFLAKEKVHKFTDWTYEHATVKHGQLVWGGIYPGLGETNAPAVLEFRRRYGALTFPSGFSY
jgi:alpha 1,2-mannosyltransferase